MLRTAFNQAIAKDKGRTIALNAAALALTAVNMFGGFAVTRRMLAMFRKKKK